MDSLSILPRLPKRSPAPTATNSASAQPLATPNIIKNYPANYFEQKSALDFAEISALAPDGILRIQVSAGKAIIYASLTDNRTNDSAIELARPIH